MMNQSGITDQVKQAYKKMLRPQTSCCGGADGTQEGREKAVKLVEYPQSDVANLPRDTVDNSFGCGNPLAFSAVKEGQTVLDLGSGAGIDLLIAAKRVGKNGKVIGVDMTEEMVERAQANVRQAGAHQVEVRHGYIEALPLEDASVDWVISNCVINLSPDKNQVFREIARVLKPGGRIAISDIVAESLPQWILDNQALYNACVAGAISEGEYIAGLEAAGLQAVEVSERLEYDRLMLKGLVEGGDIPGLKEMLLNVPEDQKEAVFEQGLIEAEGKVWSAKFIGQKPE